MTTITIDRALLEQALHVAEHAGYPLALIKALRAALAQEQAEQTWVCPDSPEHRYAKPGHCEDCGKTLVLAQEQAEPDAYGYASRLAVAIWEQHYKDTAPNWKPLDDLMGVLTQIDNMTAGLTRQEQAEPTYKTYPISMNFEWVGDRWLFDGNPIDSGEWCITLGDGGWMIYPAPQKLVPLTKGEIARLVTNDMVNFARAIERAHGIGGQDE